VPVVNTKLQDQGLTAALSYNFGPVKLAGMYERLKYDIAQGGDLTRNMWGISGMGNLGPGQYYVGYFKALNGAGSTHCFQNAAGQWTCPRVGGLTYGSGTSAQTWEASYTYPLSKRTLLYTGYVMINNKANAAYNFGVNAVGGMCTGNLMANVSGPNGNYAGNTVGCGDSGRPQGLVGGLVHFF
jgi:predicted porin